MEWSGGYFTIISKAIEFAMASNRMYRYRLYFPFLNESKKTATGQSKVNSISSINKFSRIIKRDFFFLLSPMERFKIT